MSDVLEVVILAKDEASNVFKKLGDTLGSAFKVGTGIAVAGLGAFTAAMGLAINEAMDAEVIQAKLNAVIKSTGGVAGMTAGEVNNLASELAQVTRFSDDAIVAGETMLLTFTNIGEDVFPQATEAMLNMGEMFGSVDQAAIQLGKALNDPIEGVSALRRIGVTLTQEQEDLVKSFMEVGDIASAQQVILNELAKEFGGVARAAGDTLSGKLTILKNRFMDVVESVGMKLLPVTIEIVEIFADTFIPIVEDLAETLTPFFESAIWPVQRFFQALDEGTHPIEALAGMLTDFVDVFEWMLQQFGMSAEQADKLTDAIRPLAQAFDGFIFHTIRPFVQEHAEGFKAAIIAIGAVLGGAAILGGVLAIGAAIATLFNPITLIIGAIALLAVAWTEDWGGIKTFIVNDVWPLLKIAFQELQDWLQEFIPKAILFLREVWEQYLVPLWILLKAVWEEKLQPALIELQDWFEEHIPGAIDSLKNYWDTVLMPTLQTLWDFWEDYLMPFLLDLASHFDDILPSAIDVLTGKFLGDLVPSLDDVKNAVETVKGWINQLAGAIGVGLNVALAIVSPFLDKFRIGLDGIRSAAYWVVDQISKVTASLASIPNSVPDWLIPDSPTPFEVGLRGITTALSEVDAQVMQLSNSFGNMNSQASTQSSTTNNFNLNLASNTSSENVIADFEMMRTWVGAT